MVSSEEIKIYKFTIGTFGVNNYLIHPNNSKKALLIDAGEDPSPILNKIKQLNLKLIYLINTHGHGDHIAGNEIILRETGAQLLIHKEEVAFLQDPQLNLSAFFGWELSSPAAHRLLKEGDCIELDNIHFTVLHTPGHTPGHICIIWNNHAFTGDVIFQAGIGRTDFPHSSSHQLIESIRNKIYRLPENTIIYPGHGPNTSVGEEKYNNPFVSI